MAVARGTTETGDAGSDGRAKTETIDISQVEEREWKPREDESGSRVASQQMSVTETTRKVLQTAVSGGEKGVRKTKQDEKKRRSREKG